MVFIYTEENYDSVHRSCVWQKLQDLGIEQYLILWDKEPYRVHQVEWGLKRVCAGGLR